MAFIINPNQKIDLSNPDHLNGKVLPEHQYRKNLLKMARQLGVEYDIIRILNKYDQLMRNCPNEQERKDMGKLGVLEIHNALSRGGSLYVDGQLVASDKG